MLKSFFDKFKKSNEESNLDYKTSEKGEELVEVDEPSEVDKLIISSSDSTSLQNEYNNISDTLIESQTEHLDDELTKGNEGFFERLKKGLTKTRDNISNKIDVILASYQKVDEDLLEEIEDTLIASDIGVESTMKIIDELTNKVKLERVKETLEVKKLLISIMKEKLKENIEDNSVNISNSPTIILVVGVNGVGKTTTIGKMAAKYNKLGKKVMLVAADTFRAAAIEQLTEWANRANVEIISHKEGSDPASVIFDGISSAKSKKVDILICDTAGRLHNKKNLMNELNKIHRVIDREYADAYRETLLVVDGTTGQNAIYQAKEFKEVSNLTGVVITKLDGTAKGGVVFPLQMELELPIKLIGVGEQIDNLMEFDSDKFVEAIFN